MYFMQSDQELVGKRIIYANLLDTDTVVIATEDKGILILDIDTSSDRLNTCSEDYTKGVAFTNYNNCLLSAGVITPEEINEYREEEGKRKEKLKEAANAICLKRDYETFLALKDKFEKNPYPSKPILKVTVEPDSSFRFELFCRNHHIEFMQYNEDVLKEVYSVKAEREELSSILLIIKSIEDMPMITMS